MILPTQFIPRQFPNPKNVVDKATEGAAGVVEQVTTKAPDMVNTVTDKGKDVAMSVKDKSEEGLDMYKQAQGLLESIKQLQALWEKYHFVAYIAATILVCLLLIGMIYCTVHCCYDVHDCCCLSAHDYEELDQFEKTSVPPRPRHVCLCFHFDKTYCARGCGRRRIGPKDDVGCCGDRQNWVYRWSRWTKAKARRGAGAANDRRREMQKNMREQREERNGAGESRKEGDGAGTDGSNGKNFDSVRGR